MRKRSPTRKRSERSSRRVIHHHDPARPKRGRTDWERLRRTRDAEIDQQIAADPDVAPPIDESWMADAERIEPKTKQGIFIRLDPEVLDYFKQQGPKYQTRINAVLQAYVRAQQQRGTR